MSADHLLWAILTLVGIALLLNAYCLLGLRRQKVTSDQAAELTKQTQRDLNFIQAELHELGSEVVAIKATSSVQAKQIDTISNRISSIEAKLRENESESPQFKLYQRATEMAKKGCSIDEIAATCDLPIAEAQLLVSLYHS